MAGRWFRVALAISLSLVLVRRAGAQGSETPRTLGVGTGCSYSDCALSIAPAWNGLRVVRGSDERPVANLNFFLPRDIGLALRGESMAVGADSALAHAERAVALRRAAAVLTDAGAIAVVVALARAASEGRASRADRVVGGVGLVALLASVPLQFAADGALSRAVWWHNVRYAR